MAKLRTLDVTDGYVRQLSEVDTLRYALFVLHCMRQTDGFHWSDAALASRCRVLFFGRILVKTDGNTSDHF
jgi:hypothetical protein